MRKMKQCRKEQNKQANNDPVRKMKIERGQKSQNQKRQKIKLARKDHPRSILWSH